MYMYSFNFSKTEFVQLSICYFRKKKLVWKEKEICAYTNFALLFKSIFSKMVPKFCDLAIISFKNKKSFKTILCKSIHISFYITELESPQPVLP